MDDTDNVNGEETSYLDPAQDAVDESAGSSSAEDAKEAPETTMLDEIQKVLDASEKSSESEGEPSDAETEAESDDADVADLKTGSETDPDADQRRDGDEKPPPFHEHPRWKALLKERDTLRGQVTEIESDAKVVQQFREFTGSTGLSDTEVGDGLRIMALMKDDPLKALEALRPHYEALQQITGNALPEDIAEHVEEGAITPELAAELARARGQKGIAEQRSQMAQQRAIQQHGAQIGQAVQRYTDEWQRTDADAKVKLPRVMDRVRIMLSDGANPRSPKDAVALVQTAVSDVTKEIEALQPKRQARKAIASGGKSPSSAAAKPSSMLEVVQQAAGM